MHGAREKSLVLLILLERLVLTRRKGPLELLGKGVCKRATCGSMYTASTALADSVSAASTSSLYCLSSTSFVIFLWSTGRAPEQVTAWPVQDKAPAIRLWCKIMVCDRLRRGLVDEEFSHAASLVNLALY